MVSAKLLNLAFQSSCRGGNKITVRELKGCGDGEIRASVVPVQQRQKDPSANLR